MSDKYVKIIRILEDTTALRRGGFQYQINQFVSPPRNSSYRLCEQKIATTINFSGKFFSCQPDKLPQPITDVVINTNDCSIKWSCGEAVEFDEFNTPTIVYSCYPNIDGDSYEECVSVCIAPEVSSSSSSSESVSSSSSSESVSSSSSSESVSSSSSSESVSSSSSSESVSSSSSSSVENSSSSSSGCDECTSESLDEINFGPAYGWGSITGFNTDGDLILSRDPETGIYTFETHSFTKDGECGSYYMNFEGECSEGSIIANEAQFVCGEVSMDVTLAGGLEIVYGSGICDPVAIYGPVFSYTMESSGAVDFHDCLGELCVCQIDCLPQPEPPLIPLDPPPGPDGFERVPFRAVVGLAANSISKTESVLGAFKVLTIEQYPLVETITCNGSPNNPTFPGPINLNMGTSEDYYETIGVISNIYINGGFIVLEKTTVEIPEIISVDTHTLLTSESCDDTNLADTIGVPTYTGNPIDLPEYNNMPLIEIVTDVYIDGGEIKYNTALIRASYDYEINSGDTVIESTNCS
jgi:hypothetical protein